MSMPPEEMPKVKRPFNATRPFPWRCHHCGKDDVVMSTVNYETETRHDGRLHRLTVPNLHIPACRCCGEKVFTEDVDRQITNALRLHLGIFSPAEMRAALDRLRVSQKELADCLGLAEATPSRWLNEMQIQSKSMDRFLRIFFAFPAVRAALSQERLSSDFGAADIGDESVAASFTEKDSLRRRRSRQDNAGSERWKQMCKTYLPTQQLLQRTGSGWGT
jgi:hypothetical protein